MTCNIKKHAMELPACSQLRNCAIWSVLFVDDVRQIKECLRTKSSSSKTKFVQKKDLSEN